MVCSCSNNNCSSCSGSCSPTPYYNQAGAVQECHEQPLVIQNLVAALSSSSEFVLPGCGQEAIVTFRGLTALQVGCYLWNATYGHLRVTYFNPLNGETHLTNDCFPNNVDPGAVVPRCTLFTVMAPGWNTCLQCADGNDYTYIFPAGPPPIPDGEPFAMDIVSVVGNVVTLAWHSITVAP